MSAAGRAGAGERAARRAERSRPAWYSAASSGPAADCLQVSGFSQLFDVADTVEEAPRAASVPTLADASPTACTGAALRVNYWPAEARPRDSGRGAAMPTAPDGDRDLTIWSWLCRCRATVVVVLGLGTRALPAARSCPATGPGWAARRRPAPRPCRSTCIDLTPTTRGRLPSGGRASTVRRSPATCRPAARIVGGAGRRAQGPHLRALRRQHLPDHPAAGRRSRRPARHR